MLFSLKVLFIKNKNQFTVIEKKKRSVTTNHLKKVECIEE